MIASRELEEALSAKGYKSDKGKIKALKSIAKSGDSALALEAMAMVDYIETAGTEERFMQYLTEAARLQGKRPHELDRSQVKALRQQFDAEDSK